MTGVWVQPVAARFAAARREFVRLAREVPDGAWDNASPVEGWRFRDVLAHMAEADTFLRMVVQAVLDGSDTDMRPRSAERETRIARALERGAALRVADLIARAEREGGITQEVLSRLDDNDGATQVTTSRTNPAPMSLREFLEGYQHDEEHTEHIRPAIAVGSGLR